MSDTEALVYVDLAGARALVGRLWSRAPKGRESATFEYDKTWLEHPERFALEPALTLGPGPQHTEAGKALFGALGDSAPDRWGRLLIRRAERKLAQREGRAARAPREIDFLLMVDDEARQGALRFAQKPEGPFLAPADADPIPPVVNLPRLLRASERVADDTDTDEDLRLLLAPGSSLGGARPKAAVRERGGQLAIAKFPHKDDYTDVELWEALSLQLARNAGVDVPESRIENVVGKNVLVVRRFDRAGATRISFLSAMSMLGAKDNEPHSYLEIADAIRRYGAQPDADLKGTLETDRVHGVDFKHGRSSAQPRLPLRRTAWLASLARLRSQPRSNRYQGTRSPHLDRRRRSDRVPGAGHGSGGVFRPVVG